MAFATGLVHVPAALLALLAAATSAQAIEVFATNIFSPDPVADEDPGLSGLMRVDLVTGSATTFIADNPATGFFLLTDVAVGPHDGLVYATTQLGGVFRFDAQTGQPLAGEPTGQFAQLNGAGNGLLFAPDGTLYVAEIGQAGGGVAIFSPQGVRQAVGPSGLPFAAGLALLPDGDLLIGSGGLAALGTVERWDAQTQTLSNFIPAGGLGGIIDLTILPAAGDYDGSGATDTADIAVWAAAYGENGGPADGNRDGVVDAADYTIARDNAGAAARVLTTDFFGNALATFALDGGDPQVLVQSVPPAIPAPLPPLADFGSNFPSEVLISPTGTLLVSTLGLTRRPDNRAAILEYDRKGNLLGTLAEGLPPISGIALAPPIAPPVAVPEPSALLLAGAALAAARRGHR